MSTGSDKLEKVLKMDTESSGIAVKDCGSNRFVSTLP